MKTGCLSLVILLHIAIKGHGLYNGTIPQAKPMIPMVASLFKPMERPIGAFLQGSWNIKYLPSDSLNSSFIGKEIRIDFRSFDADILQGPVKVFSIRKLLSNKDTVRINLNGKSLRFIEDWKLYVDHGSLKEQGLVSIDKQEVAQIKEMYLVDINKSSLTVDVATYNSKKESKRERVVISRNDVKGILTRIN